MAELSYNHPPLHHDDNSTVWKSLKLKTSHYVWLPMLCHISQWAVSGASLVQKFSALCVKRYELNYRICKDGKNYIQMHFWTLCMIEILVKCSCSWMNSWSLVSVKSSSVVKSSFLLLGPKFLSPQKFALGETFVWREESPYWVSLW